MITVRRSNERGHFDHGWLDTRHTFSFGDYRDPKHMGFRDLRVINEDVVQPGAGFPTHAHADMEIVTYVLSGALEHKDSMGTGSVIRPGEAQRMTAGTGVTHSEYNASRTEPVHLLQIWIIPDRRGLRPEYEQKAFPEDQRLGRLRLIASPDGAAGSLTPHQDVRIYDSLVELGAKVRHDVHPGRFAWLQVTRGRVLMNGEHLSAGDGAAISDEATVEVVGDAPDGGRSGVLLFDLA
jgi:redox-sensitive bicupin YhaK (pirin superfamily)